MPVTTYVRLFDPETRKRHRHETRRGQVVDFVVQLEALIDDHWVPIMRYDMAHGRPHVDRFETERVKTKELLDLSPAAALTLGDEDVTQNWGRYKEAFLARSRR